MKKIFGRFLISSGLFLIFLQLFTKDAAAASTVKFSQVILPLKSNLPKEDELLRAINTSFARNSRLENQKDGLYISKVVQTASDNTTIFGLGEKSRNNTSGGDFGNTVYDYRYSPKRGSAILDLPH